jgi:transposase
MPKKRRTFSREFKIEAVKLVTEKGQSIAEAARSLGLHDNLLRLWKKSFDQELHGDQPAFPGHGNRPALEQQIHELRIENRRLQMERDILKKATALFAKEGM